MDNYPFGANQVLYYRTTLLQTDDLSVLIPLHDAYFSLNSTLLPNTVTKEGFFEVVLFHSIVRDYIGVYSPGRVDFCCTEELAAAGKCATNRFLLNYPAGEMGENYVQHFVFELQPGLEEYKIEIDKVHVQHRGTWYAYFINCHPENSFTWVGSVTWKNPFGYLGASEIAFIPVQWLLSVGYFLISVAWIYRSIKFRKNLMGIQYLILAVLLFGFVEHLTSAIDYTIYNNVGRVSDFLNIIYSTATSGKETLFRLVILLVALGYSITRPSLESKSKIAIIVSITLYGIFEAIYYYLLSARATGLYIINFWVYLCTLVTVACNTFFVAWIAWSSYYSIKTLKKTYEVKKYIMYRNLGMLLSLSLLMSIVFWMSEQLFDIMDALDNAYSISWVFGAYWYFLYFFIIVYVCRIWRPIGDNIQYAFIGVESDVSMEDITDRKKSVSLDTADSSGESGVSVVTLDDERTPRVLVSSDSSSLLESSS